MKLLLTLTIALMLGCTTYPNNPKTVKTNEFQPLVEEFANTYQEIDKIPGPYDEESQRAMQVVLSDIEDLISQLRHFNPGTYVSTFYLNEYNTTFIRISKDYDIATRIIGKNWMDRPEDSRVRMKSEHEKLTGFAKHYLNMSRPQPPANFIPNMTHLLNMVISIARIARQVTG